MNVNPLTLKELIARYRVELAEREAPPRLGCDTCDLYEAKTGRPCMIVQGGSSTLAYPCSLLATEAGIPYSLLLRCVLKPTTISLSQVE